VSGSIALAFSFCKLLCIGLLKPIEPQAAIVTISFGAISLVGSLIGCCLELN